MASKFFIQRGEKSHGPFSLDQIQGGVRSQKLTRDDRCSESSGGPWAPLSELVPELFEEDPLGFDGLLSTGFEPPPTEAVPAIDSIHCRSCGQENPADTIACSGCGVPPRRGRAFCGKCGNRIINPEAIMCVKCRTMLDTPSLPTPSVAGVSSSSVISATTGINPPFHWWYLNALQQYAVFNGRARRKAYWMFVLCNFIVTFILAILGAALMGPAPSGNPAMLSNLYSLAVLVPSIAVGVRRMHDTNHSGWFLLVPFYNVYLACIEGTRGPNRFGENPKPENESTGRR
jgi:uncharacterized membrane protein YhaH (DUF805 family)